LKSFITFHLAIGTPALLLNDDDCDDDDDDDDDDG